MITLKLVNIPKTFSLPMEKTEDFLNELSIHGMFGKDRSKWLDQASKRMKIESLKSKQEVFEVDEKLNIILLNQALLSLENLNKKESFLELLTNNFGTSELKDYFIENFSCSLSHDTELKTWLSFIAGIGNQDTNKIEEAYDSEIKAVIEGKKLDISFIHNLNKKIDKRRK